MPTYGGIEIANFDSIDVIMYASPELYECLTHIECTAFAGDKVNYPIEFDH